MLLRPELANSRNKVIRRNHNMNVEFGDNAGKSPNDKLTHEAGDKRL